MHIPAAKIVIYLKTQKEMHGFFIFFRNFVVKMVN